MNNPDSELIAGHSLITNYQFVIPLALKFLIFDVPGMNIWGFISLVIDAPPAKIDVDFPQRLQCLKKNQNLRDWAKKVTATLFFPPQAFCYEEPATPKPVSRPPTL